MYKDKEEEEEFERSLVCQNLVFKSVNDKN